MLSFTYTNVQYREMSYIVYHILVPSHSDIYCSVDYMLSFTYTNVQYREMSYIVYHILVPSHSDIFMKVQFGT